MSYCQTALFEIWQELFWNLSLFDLLHADLWGPYKYRIQGNCIYFLIIVEDKSRSTWIILLADKAQVLNLIHEFITYVKTQFGVILKVLRTDNGTEFVNRELSQILANCGIIY